MRLIYPMSSEAHVNKVIVRLHRIGAEARLLPGGPSGTRGQWLEVHVAEAACARVRAIVRHIDPAAHYAAGPLG